MSKIYGYARVSTKEQNEDRQLIALKEAGVPLRNIYIDKQSGKDFERTMWRKLSVSRESGNIIHTVVDEPIRIDDLSEKAALNYLRDVISTWYFLMMEKYGKRTRDKELSSFVNSKEAWEYSFIARVKTAQRYDCSIEYIADYRPKEKRIEDIWQDIATIQNITKDNVLQVEYARQMLKEIRENDFQRRF